MRMPEADAAVAVSAALNVSHSYCVAGQFILSNK